jgi:GTP-binding protein
MKVRDVEYIGSFGYPNKLPREQRPEVAMFGRSNVGKSSLINTLLGRRGVARISKTPGKTRSANFFKINDRFFLVDMPGYGFARASKTEIARWSKIFDQYVADLGRNNALVQLIDVRHDPTSADVDNVRRMSQTGRPLCLVFNKADKVKASQLRTRIGKSLSLLDVSGDAAVIAFSSVSGVGKRELWGWIADSLEL